MDFFGIKRMYLDVLHIISYGKGWAGNNSNAKPGSMLVIGSGFV